MHIEAVRLPDHAGLSIDSDRAHSRGRETVARVLVHHLPIIFLFGGFAVLGAVSYSAFRAPMLTSAAFWVPVVLYFPGSVVAHLARTLMSGDGAVKLVLRRATWSDYLEENWTRDRILGAVFMFLLIPLLLGTFHGWKGLIPSMNPFSWDVAFAEWDRAIHLGVDPWRVTHAIASSEAATYAIDAAYSTGWGLAVLLPLAWFSFAKLDAFRLQYFLTFGFIIIVLGCFAASWMSSVGPCFFDALLGRGDFAPLMSRLHEVDETRPLTSIYLQDILWNSYVSAEPEFPGISAMPSIHVAMVTLLALAAWRVKPWLGLVAALFAGLILFGSVHLGWHYAIDGYVSIVAVLVIWWVAGIFSRWWVGVTSVPSVAEVANDRLVPSA